MIIYIIGGRGGNKWVNKWTNDWGIRTLFCTYKLWLNWTRITSRVHGILELYRFLYFQEVTIFVYLRVWKSHVLHIQGSIKKPSRIMCLFKGCFVSRTLRLDDCDMKKAGFFMFLDSDRLFVKTFRLSRALCLFRKGVLSSKSVKAYYMICFRPKLYRA